MGDTNTGDEQEIVTGAESEEGTDDTQDESQNDGGAEDKGASGDDNGDGAGDGADDKGGGEDGAEDKTKATDKKPIPKVDEEPPARKRNVDFILERKNAKIAKLQDKNNKPNNDEADEDDDVAPEDAEIIDKRVQKHLKPFIEKQIAEEDKAEIDAFIAQNPDFKPYADKVAKWSKHPSRQGLPIKSIFYEVAGDDLMKIGADRSRKADIEAKKTGAGGGNNRGNGGGAKPVLEQTPEEFEATQNAVRSKSRE